MMVFGGVWSFLKRHRRKFVFAGVVVAGAVWLSKYARRRLREYQEKEATECLAHIRRQHHFDSNQRTCNATVLSMLPCLKESLCRKLNTEQLTEQLRARPANKVEIWEKLKEMSLTRTLAAVYSSCMLVIYLRVQLNILGGCMYLDSLQLSSDDDKLPSRIIVTSDVRQQYLSGVRFIFEQGLDKLIADLHKAVKNVLSGYSLRDQVSSLTISEIVDNVRRLMEHGRENGYRGTKSSGMSQYMMETNDDDDDDSQACMLTQEATALNQLNNETKDMIESSDFRAVLAACLDSGFTRLVDKVSEYFLPCPQSETATHESMPPVATLPLAKVIPIVNGLVHIVLADPPNQFIQELLLKDQVKDFAANVYEAFSRSNDIKCSIT